MARQAFRLGESLVASSISDADRIAAVVHLDFALETALRAVLFDRQHPKARTDRFKELLNSVAEVSREEGWATDVPARGAIEQARGVRNAAQREARVPTPEELFEALVHTRDALRLLVDSCWSVEFLDEDVAAVRSSQVVGYLTRAQAAIQGGDLVEAMGWINAAFICSFEHGGENIVGRTVDVEALAVHDRGTRPDDSDPYGKGAQAATALRRLQVLGRLNTINIRVGDYLRWRQVMAAAPALNIRGNLIRHQGEKKDWTADEVSAAFAYVVDVALKMERVVPDLQPGGFVRGGFDNL